MANDPANAKGTGGWLTDFPPRRRHLLLAGAALLIVYAAGTTGKWWPTPDSSLYQGLARSIADGDGYQFNGEPSTRVAPGLPLMLAGLRVAFGPGYWAPNILMTLCGLGGLVLAYLTLARVGEKRIAFAAVLATGFTYTYFSDTHLILTDAPFALLLWTSLYSAVRFREGSAWWAVPTVLAAAWAVTVRAPGVLILGPAALGLMIDAGRGATRRRRVISGAAMLAAVLLVFTGMYVVSQLVSDRQPGYVARSIGRGPLERLYELGAGALRAPEIAAEIFTSQDGTLVAATVGVFALALIVFGGAHLWRRGHRAWPTIPLLYALALCVIKHRDALKARYMLPIVPILLYMAVVGACWAVWTIARRCGRTPTPRACLIAATVLTAVVIGSNVPRVFRNAFYYGYYARTSEYYEIIRDRDFVGLFGAAEAVRKACPAPPEPSADDAPVAVVDNEFKSILHYLTDRRTVSFPEPPARIAADAYAERVFDAVRDVDRPVCCVVIDRERFDGARYEKAFLRRLEELLGERGPVAPAERIYERHRFVVYAKRPATARPR